MLANSLFTYDSHQQGQATTLAIPGKLYVAGEYAVLEPGQAAIIMAVDHYLHVSIEPTTETINSVHSPQLSSQPLSISTKAGTLVFEGDNSTDWSYVSAAIAVTYRLLTELDQALLPFKITIASQMVDETGRKYGLGSSGAVTVGIILSLLHFHGIHPQNPRTLFKLAALAGLKRGTQGSMGDLAAITHGQCVYYQPFDRNWVHVRLAICAPLVDVLAQKWPSLEIERLPWPAAWTMAIGWTESPASTDAFISQLHEGQALDPQPYATFVNTVNPLVQALRQTIKDQDLAHFLTLIKTNHKALQSLGQAYNVPIVTPQLATLADQADHFGGAGKASGAGGGDCGISFFPQAFDLRALIAAWQAAGITYLPLALAKPIPL